MCPWQRIEFATQSQRAPMDVPLSYMFAHPEYYETLQYANVGNGYLEVVTSLLSAEWTQRRTSIWYQVSHPASELREQGFKIHVSATPANAVEILNRVVPLCREATTVFKFVADETLLRLTVGKRWSRGASGKFLTIYPRDTTSFADLIERIYERTADLEGPYILSDRRYRESRVVYYRYGGFRGLPRLNVDGTSTPQIRAPDGTLIDDRRAPEFRLPAWVDDPCPVQQPDSNGPVLLMNRFEVESAIQFSNSGGVYTARDIETGQKVIIKEARPHTNCWQDGPREIDATDLLRREYAILKHLSGSTVAPEPIALFSEWEHLYIAEEFVPGQLLAHIRASSTYALVLKLHDTGRAQETLPAFRWLFCLIARELLRIVSECHSRDVLLGDLSPRNVVIDVPTKLIRLIDFESAMWSAHPLESFAATWGTTGFVSPQRRQTRALTPIDDYFAIAMLLYSFLLPIESLFELVPQHRLTWLEYLVSVGLPTAVRDTIVALLQGSPQAALEILDKWELSH